MLQAECTVETCTREYQQHPVNVRSLPLRATIETRRHEDVSAVNKTGCDAHKMLSGLNVSSEGSMHPADGVRAMERRYNGSAIEDTDMHCAGDDDWPFQNIPRACGGSRKRQPRNFNAAEAALPFRR